MAKDKLKRSVSDVESELSRIEDEIKRHKRAVERGKPVSPAPVLSATRIEQDIKKEIRAERRFSGKGPLLFYFFTSILCVSVLAYLFGTALTFVFYLVFGLFIWWWAHQFHSKKAGMLKSFFSLGSIVVALYMFYWIFSDLLSLIMCALYAISFVIAGVLYFYHTRRELSEEIHKSFPKTFIVVLYSHIIALTAGASTAYILSDLVFGDAFVGMAYIFFIWLLPSLFMYFFFAKFLYLSYFDRKHIRRDVFKGIMHGAIYSVAFVVLLLLAYVMTAIQFANDERAGYADEFGISMQMFTMVKPDLTAVSLEEGSMGLMNLDLTKQVISESVNLVYYATGVKSTLDEPLSVSDYFNDNYFTVLSRNRALLVNISIIAKDMDVLKRDLIREYKKLNVEKNTGVFDDGTTSLDTHYRALVAATQYSPFVLPDTMVAEMQRIADSYDSYSGLVLDDGLLDWNIQYDPSLSLLKSGDSVFSKAAYRVFHHSAIYRDLMILVFDRTVFEVQDMLDPHSIRLIADELPDESLNSRVLRYRILKINSDATIDIVSS